MSGMFGRVQHLSSRCNGVRRDADTLERERIGVEQIRKVARPAAELPRERVERFVERDRAASAAAELADS